MVTEQGPSLVEVIGQYLPRLKGDEQREGQQELHRFVQWCGRDRAISQLTPSEIAEYGESASIWGADSAKKLKPVKSFLTYLKERRLTSVSLAPHLKVSKAKKGSRRVYFKSIAERAELTAEGYANLKSRLDMLKEERINVIADIQRAMADKDFRENAPLDAAKERQGLIESSLKELEGILVNAVVADGQDSANSQQVKMGRKVTLREVSSGKEVCYTLVDSREADPATGKISSISPVGKALLDRMIGEEVHITVPRGTLHYRVEKVESWSR